MFLKTKHTMYSVLMRMSVYSLILIVSILSISNRAKAHDCPGDEENQASIDDKVDIIRLLADQEDWSEDDVNRNVIYSRNDYGCHEDLEIEHDGGWIRAYPAGGGHAGWDVDFIQDDHHPFYSITRGILVAIGQGTSNTIAIYDPANGRMVLYLHASAVNRRLDVGEWIDFKTYLGDQGREGFATGEHIHIEVRTLTARQRNLPFPEQMEELTRASRGRFDRERPTINPIPYLYHFVEWYLEEEAANACLIWAELRDID